MMHIAWQICFEKDQKKQKALKQAYDQTVYDLNRNWKFKWTQREKLEMESRRIHDEIL